MSGTRSFPSYKQYRRQLVHHIVELSESIEGEVKVCGHVSLCAVVCPTYRHYPHEDIREEHLSFGLFKELVSDLDADIDLKGVRLKSRNLVIADEIDFKFAIRMQFISIRKQNMGDPIVFELQQNRNIG
jgi:hypothetical protein